MATRNFVPRADGEGSLGTSAKKWGDVQAVKATIANVTGKATEAASADTATKLATPRTIALSGDATVSRPTTTRPFRATGVVSARISCSADRTPNPLCGKNETSCTKSHGR